MLAKDIKGDQPKVLRNIGYNSSITNYRTLAEPEPLTFWSPQQELNPHRKIRILALCPLSYEDFKSFYIFKFVNQLVM